ncbi:TRAP transporter small permease [Calditerrivibrio nitroreducens]|uniref:Tripartite ATP-independent periplasmic transporter DctQ component n=1 Tax=Calditerrivibrio nitroreducens (strain DSM 19672 / NBRC 101217 / Yu37-1) TaxID=768670 RepID=E4TFV6_CALNY|nr:TRAP transporter small permease [Calditerrivibrio nitroreducens]ADR19612.1 Tripartite ATP-independent periplasmic transporter DctQ component [Calditerrivibrio nitroreducens DSM 19672]
MVKIFEIFDNWLDKINIFIMSVMMAVATVVAFINVVLRYGFNMSLTWAGELTSYLFIWSVLFGTAYGFKTGLHLGVTFLIQRLNSNMAKKLLTFSLFVVFVFLLVLIKWGYDFVKFNYELEQVSVDLHIKFWIIYLCVPITMAISAYQILMKIIKIIRMPAEEFSYNMVMKEH